MTQRKNQTVTLSKDVYEAMNKEYTHVLSQYQNLLALAMAHDFIQLIRKDTISCFGSKKSDDLRILHESLLDEQCVQLKTT